MLGFMPMLSSAQSPYKRELIRTAPGPWGAIEYYRIPLDAPEESLNLLTLPSQQVEWNFPPGGRSVVRSMSLAAGVDPAEVDRIISGSIFMQTPNATRVFPSDETVLAIPHQSRIIFYKMLSGLPDNQFYTRPVYIDSENLSAWFSGINIPRDAIEDVSILAYRTPHNRGFFFSDAPLLLRRALSTRDEQAIVRGIYRKQSLIAQIRINKDSPMDQLVQYWMADYKNKAVLPILEAAITGKDEGTVDLTHLLPSTARQLLNRYPEPGDGITGRYPDWFWTCYNFFRFTPKNVYVDSPDRMALLLQEFTPAAHPLQFGDVLLLYSGSELIHGCVHIADEIVYTKNGADIFSPWVMMRLDDVVDYHDFKGDITISIYRRNVTSN